METVDPLIAQNGDRDGADAFQCRICLELVYKPVVQACGHVFCFWCLQHSMNAICESHCPICRHPYMHFPRVCKMLHFMLQKAEPEEYKRRELEIKRTEEETGFFSPCFTEGDAKEEDVALMVDDCLCPSCRRLLYRPVVLNCGDVFCESCLRSNTESSLACPTCGAPPCGGLAQVCLELHHFLERTFPSEYKSQEDAMLAQMELPQCSVQNRSLDDLLNEEAEITVHVGIGCDGCGMFPIIGDRYRCKDCPEAVGFDLCETCQLAGGSPVGRFNQQHKSGHQMRKICVDDAFLTV